MALAERLQIPITTTWMPLIFSRGNTRFVSDAPASSPLRGTNFAVQNCDLLISIGCRLDNIITAYNPRGSPVPPKKSCRY